MLDQDKAYEGLKEVFAEVFMRDDIVLSPMLTAKDVEGWDSFKQIEIIMATEQWFGMRFTSMEVDGMRSIQDLVVVVCNRAKKVSE